MAENSRKKTRLDADLAIRELQICVPHRCRLGFGEKSEFDIQDESKDGIRPPEIWKKYRRYLGESNDDLEPESCEHACQHCDPQGGWVLKGRLAIAHALDRLLEQADIVSLHCPLTDATRGLIGAAQLARMKPDALLINTARGPVVDEAAVVEALRSGKLAGAGLDTFAVEPPDPANPLFALPNVIVTPHIAAATTGAMVRMGTIAANNILSWLRGEVYDSRNFLNPQVVKTG